MGKTYVFLNRRICGVDGSIQYIYNKTQYLTSVGYEILVFSVLDGDILVESFEKYKPLIIPEMRFCPSLFRKSDRKRVINKVLNLLSSHSNGEIIIESTSPVSAVWGELIARELNCRHVFFHVMEKTDLPKGFRSFCRFKYDRGELAGITDKTVPLLLADETARPVRIVAYCNNPFSECKDLFSEKLDKTADVTIGSIGRLEKAYVPKLAQEMSDYFEKNYDKRFNFIMIGGDTAGKIAKRLEERFAQCANVKFLITGYLYPIPLSLIRNIDFFISASGSATGTYRLGKPTININPLTGAPVGIIGCDYKYKEKTFYDSSELLTIENCVDRLVRNEAEIIYEAKLDEGYKKKMALEFERQLQMVLNNKNRLIYYNEKKLCSLKTPFKKHHELYAFACHILGADRFVHTVEIAK